jgi:hypothetical protein
MQAVIIALNAEEMEPAKETELLVTIPISSIQFPKAL